MRTLLKRNSPITFSTEQIGSLLISVAIFSTFIPIKVYPILFVITAIYLVFSSPTIQRIHWTFWLWSYIGYAFLLTYLRVAFTFTPLSIRPSIDVEKITDFTKLIINSFLLTASVNWLLAYSGRVTRRYLDYMLHFVFFFTLLQLLVYIAHSGISQLGITESSNAASSIYDPKLCFWFTADKNIFGARIAIFGFIYLLNYFIETRRLPIWRSFIVMLCAFLSNSRTPMAALFLGIVYVLFRRFRWKGRILLATSIALIAPFFVLKLLRFDNLMDTNDGMGIRLIYWSTFFSNFSDLSIFGRGFLSAKTFLSQNSAIYLGEPHLHNLFLNNYLDSGLPGEVFYIAFLVSFYRFCKRTSSVWFSWYWTAAYLPLLAIMATLSSGYESDTSVYLFAIFLIGYSASHSELRHKVDSTTLLRQFHS